MPDPAPAAIAMPRSWREPPSAVETHISVVMFIGDRAYKILKPVETGFLDHTDPAVRRTAGLREVELNRRLAPDVYLGVADFGLPGDPPEAVIVMRRMPADRRLSNLLDRPEAEIEVRRVARVLAAFHRDAARPAAAAAAATPDAVRRLWRENLEELRAVAAGVLQDEDIAAVEALAIEYLDGHEDLMRARIEEDLAVDGHGDLLADDVFCLEDGPRILDCLAFSDRLRMGDVIADLAFLAMDLERLGHPALAAALLDEHAAVSGDRAPTSLADHWIAYRASVRAKVACYRAPHDPDAHRDAGRLLSLCRRRLERARLRIVLIGGGPGVGKSTLAEAVAGALGAEWIQSDAVRKDLAGLPRAPLKHAPGVDEELYSAGTSARVYREMLDRAVDLARRGRSSILDASWTSAAERAHAREHAAREGADLIEIECRAPDGVADARIVARRRLGNSPSDATPRTAAALRARRDPWPESTPLYTTGDPAEAVRAALTAITSPRPRSPHGAGRAP